MAHEEFHLIPLPFTLSSILAVDDIWQTRVPGSATITIYEISAGCRALTSGTATLVVKNNAGSTVTSIVLATGSPVVGSLSISSIIGGDRLRVGMSGIGVGLVDVSGTITLKMPSIA